MSSDPPTAERVPHNRWIALATRRPVGLLMISLAIVVFGVISFMRLPMDLMPDVSYPTITVRTQYPGAAPADVEDRVSRRLEQSLSVIKNLRRISSVSRAESSDVVLEFSWDNDLKASLQEIREKLDQTFLPDEAESPTILRYDPNLDPILQVGLVGQLDLKALRLLAEEEVERRLETVAGVAAVRVRGGLEDEIRVAVDEQLIQNRGITLDEISRRLAEENLDQASGLLREGDVSYVVRTMNQLQTVEEIEAIPLRREGDSIIRLGDVATVVSTHKERKVITRIDGDPAVKVEVYREAGANIVELAARVRERLFGTAEQQEELVRWRESLRETVSVEDLKKEEKEESADGKSERKSEWEGGEWGDESTKIVARPDFIGSYLPRDVRLELLSDQSTFIQGSINDLLQTAVLGGLLAFFVLYVFLGRFLYTAIVGISIPFSVVATFAPMHLGGISLNIMSLGGLALGIGMLVDSSIVVLEAIFRRRESGEPMHKAAVAGASEVGGAVLASTLTTVAVFFPIVFVEGMAGQVFRDQSLTVVFSLLASLAASLTLIPMLSALIERIAGSGERSPSLGRLLWKPIFLERFGGFAKMFTWSMKRLAPLRVPLAVLGSLVYLPYCLFATTLELVLYGVYLFYSLGVLLFGLFLVGIGHVFRFLVQPVVSGFGHGFAAVEKSYLKLLRGALHVRGVVGALALLSLIGAGFAGRELGQELIPEVSQGEFVAHVKYSVGTPLAVTEERVAEFDQELATVEGIASVAATVGVDPEDVQAVDEGEHSARFHIRLNRTDGPLDQLEQQAITRVGEVLGGVADHSVEISRPALFSFRTPIEVEVRGYNLTELRRLGREAASLVATIPALRDVRSNISRGNPEYHLFPDREKMVRHGVNSQQLADVLRKKNMGNVATRFRTGDRRVDVRVQTQEDDRESINDLLSLMVAPGTDGGGITVADIVDGWEVLEGPSEIRRIHQQRAAVISAELSGLDLGRVSESIEAKLADLKLPPEFTVEVVGQKKEMEQSRDSLLEALLLAVFLVYVVMASQFESLVQPFIILFTIPLAAVGVTYTLYLTDTSLSIISFIGMIVLAGIVVNNAIVLIDQVNRLRDDGFGLEHALVEGCRRRLRPILMTTTTTILGMIPLTGILAQIPHGPELDLLLGTGQGAEIRAPLAYTVIGGLLSSTLLTLIVIPVVYSLVARKRAVVVEES